MLKTFMMCVMSLQMEKRITHPYLQSTVILLVNINVVYLIYLLPAHYISVWNCNILCADILSRWHTIKNTEDFRLLILCFPML